jgi:hypothetical protein
MSQSKISNFFEKSIAQSSNKLIIKSPLYQEFRQQMLREIETLKMDNVALCEQVIHLRREYQEMRAEMAEMREYIERLNNSGE